MLFTMQIDKVELDAAMATVKDVMVAVIAAMSAFGEKDKSPEFEIPTKSIVQNGRWGRTTFDVSPTGMTAMLEVKPECTADFIGAYAKMLTMLSIPAAQLVVASMMLTGQLEAAEAAFAEKWGAEAETEEVKVEVAKAKAS